MLNISKGDYQHICQTDPYGKLIIKFIMQDTSDYKIYEIADVITDHDNLVEYKNKIYQVIRQEVNFDLLEGKTFYIIELEES